MKLDEPPVWLTEEPEISGLLHAILDRFDRQRGDSRQRNVLVSSEKYLGSLARVDAQADQCWAFVRELERLRVLSIRSARRNVLDPEWQGARLAFPPESERILRNWMRRAWSESAMELWRQAVFQHAAAFPSGCDPLLTRRIDIPGRGAAEVVSAFSRIASVKGPITLRQLSAGVFWGNSKVLDERAELIAALFPDVELLDRMLVVSVFLAGCCNGVLFIENQDTYTAAAGGFPAASRNLALVYAAGFRSSAARVRSRRGALIHYAGPGVSTLQTGFEDWWYDNGTPPGPCWFWGDLDFAGMQILKSLRNRFEGLTAWQPGYAPMVQTLHSRGGYAAPKAGEDPAQVDPGLTGCVYADNNLLPAVREYGQIDQESIL